jgi:uncharacterized protein (DUF2147 family)
MKRHVNMADLLPWRLAIAACVTVAAVRHLPAQTTPATPAPMTPVGLWDTISDTDGRPTGLVEIQEVNGEYVGIVRGILVPASHEDSICTKCSGERKDQPVVGMEILRHMRPDGTNEWSGGEILDPENGKTYRAKMKLSDDGRTLTVRGYLGVSLFGRSQKWVRAQAP